MHNEGVHLYTKMQKNISKKKVLKQFFSFIGVAQ